MVLFVTISAENTIALNVMWPSRIFCRFRCRYILHAFLHILFAMVSLHSDAFLHYEDFFRFKFDARAFYFFSESIN